MVSQTPAWDELMGLLFSEKDLMTIEWMIGAAQDPTSTPKTLYIYGGPATGKSTLLGFIREMLGVEHDYQDDHSRYAPLGDSEEHFMFIASQQLPDFSQWSRPDRIALVRTTGQQHEFVQYLKLVDKIPDEYGYIAAKCGRLYVKAGKDLYKPIPLNIATQENH